MVAKRDKISKHPMSNVIVELGRLFVGNGREECAIIAIRFSQCYKYVSRIQFSGVHVRTYNKVNIVPAAVAAAAVPTSTIMVLQRCDSFLQDKDATTNGVSHTSAARFYFETHYTSSEK